MKINYLFVFFFGTTNAFGHAGSFERVFLFYAMKIDAAIHHGTPQFIATGCIQDADFNQFIAYVDNTVMPLRSMISNGNDMMRSASDLTSRNLKRLTVESIVPVAPNHNPPSYGKMLRLVANYLCNSCGPAIMRDNALIDLFMKALSALQYALYAREVAYHKRMIAYLRRRGFSYSAQSAQWLGYRNPPMVLNLKETLAQNLAKNRNKIRNKYFKLAKPDGAHMSMLRTIKDCIERFERLFRRTASPSISQ
jgi:hypothetical protein